MIANVDWLWWSAFVGGALWGAIITLVCGLLTVAVWRAWRRDKRNTGKPGRL